MPSSSLVVSQGGDSTRPQVEAVAGKNPEGIAEEGLKPRAKPSCGRYAFNPMYLRCHTFIKYYISLVSLWERAIVIQREECEAAGRALVIAGEGQGCKGGNNVKFVGRKL